MSKCPLQGKKKMPILVEKIIHIRDYGSHYNRLEFEFSKPKNIEYGSGVFKK